MARQAPGTWPQPWRWRLPGGALPWAGVLGVLLAFLLLVPYLGDSMELVRLRNALLLAPGPALPTAAFAWRADEPPPGFVQDDGAFNPFYRQLAQQLRLADLPSDWERVLAISQQLLSAPTLRGTAIQNRLDASYQAIVTQGLGYCGDFTRVFMGLALASGMPVRAWSFSLDGFGGHGHIWPEVWNRQLQQWQLVDVFNNAYLAGADGVALSALALRQALQQGTPGLRLLPLVPQARPGYRDPARAWAYYRSGLPQWYMQWGNAVFAYDQALLVRTLEPVSHALAQLGGMLQGVSPRIHVLADTRNAQAFAALQRLRSRIGLAVVLGALGLLALGLALRRAWRRSPGGA